MNHYPSWIQRIPEMIEALELHAADRVDRQTVGELFDLRKTAAFHLLRRFGAERIDTLRPNQRRSLVPVERRSNSGSI